MEASGRERGAGGAGSLTCARHIGLKDWERRLIISDRAHLGKCPPLPLLLDGCPHRGPPAWPQREGWAPGQDHCPHGRWGH